MDHLPMTPGNVLEALWAKAGEPAGLLSPRRVDAVKAGIAVAGTVLVGLGALRRRRNPSAAPSRAEDAALLRLGPLVNLHEAGCEASGLLVAGLDALQQQGVREQACGAQQKHEQAGIQKAKQHVSSLFFSKVFSRNPS